MTVVESYALAVAMCVVTMFCWGSWANTQKLASKEWRFELFYWDYAIGVLLLALILAFTLGSTGTAGRSFLDDLAQADSGALWSAFIGGVVFNLSNILLVAAIDIAGMSVAFPIGVGLALVLGVVTNYMATPVGNPLLLFLGVGFVVAAIILSAMAYSRLPQQGQRTIGKGIMLSVVAGLLMGFFYRFVAASMSTDFINLEPGKLSPYTAIVMFSVGLLASNFLWNPIVMKRPFVGPPVPFGDYFSKGTPRLHMIGILGGIIWNLGMSLSIIAAGGGSVGCLHLEGIQGRTSRHELAARADVRGVCHWALADRRRSARLIQRPVPSGVVCPARSQAHAEVAESRERSEL
jgi:glucose uptake protein